MGVSTVFKPNLAGLPFLPHFQIDAPTSWILSTSLRSEYQPLPTSWTLQRAFCSPAETPSCKPSFPLLPDLVFSQAGPPFGSSLPCLPFWEPILGTRVQLLAFSGIPLTAECRFVSLFELWAQSLSWCRWEPTGIQIQVGQMWSICGFSVCYPPSHPTSQRFYVSSAGGCVTEWVEEVPARGR